MRRPSEYHTHSIAARPAPRASRPPFRSQRGNDLELKRVYGLIAAVEFCIRVCLNSHGPSRVRLVLTQAVREAALGVGA